MPSITDVVQTQNGAEGWGSLTPGLCWCWLVSLSWRVHAERRRSALWTVQVQGLFELDFTHNNSLVKAAKISALFIIQPSRWPHPPPGLGSNWGVTGAKSLKVILSTEILYATLLPLWHFAGLSLLFRYYVLGCIASLCPSGIWNT